MYCTNSVYLACSWGYTAQGSLLQKASKLQIFNWCKRLCALCSCITTWKFKSRTSSRINSRTVTVSGRAGQHEQTFLQAWAIRNDKDWRCSQHTEEHQPRRCSGEFPHEHHHIAGLWALQAVSPGCRRALKGRPGAVLCRQLWGTYDHQRGESLSP